MLACLWTLGPGASATLPDAAAGGGQYHIVVNGVLAGARVDEAGHETGEETLLPRWSCQYAFADDGEVTLRATDAGAQVLLLRFPRAADLAA